MQTADCKHQCKIFVYRLDPCIFTKYTVIINMNTTIPVSHFGLFDKCENGPKNWK